MRTAFLLMLLFASAVSFSQDKKTLAIRTWRQQHESAIVNEFVSFLSIPNIAADTTGLQKSAQFILSMMRQRGISKLQLLPAVTKGAPPAVYGEVLTPGAKQTLIFYAHYDGQPANPAQWAPGLAPFTPNLFTGSLLAGGHSIALPASGPYDPQWRIYALGASDDKAGVDAILNAYDALVKTGMKPFCNLKFFFEGEEEAGSPHLGEILERHKALLESDLWIMCDGPVHQSGKKQLVFGVRGDAHLDLTVYGPTRPLHSGHYGNWAPNPALMLAKLLASMKDDSGRVAIKGFYDDVQPLTASEQKALQDVPSADGQMREELGLAVSEMKGKSLSEAINLPSLNINGMQSGNVGKLASNQIPTFATAVLDLRLVVGNDWKRQQRKVIDHIRLQGYTIVDHEPTDAERRQALKLIKVVSDTSSSYNAQRTAMNLPVIQQVIAAVQATTPDPLVLQPSSGGSLPLYLFDTYLQAHTVSVPVANHDNNQHAENENIRLLNLWNGIETMAAVMMGRGQ